LTLQEGQARNTSDCECNQRTCYHHIIASYFLAQLETCYKPIRSQYY